MDNLRRLYDADALKFRFDSNQLLSSKGINTETGCSLLSKRLLEPVHPVRCLFVTAVYNSVCFQTITLLFTVHCRKGVKQVYMFFSYLVRSVANIQNAAEFIRTSMTTPIYLWVATSDRFCMYCSKLWTIKPL